MPQEPLPQSFQVRLKRFEYNVRQFWKEVWPFKWDIWQEPKALLGAISISPYPLKVAIVSSFVVTMIASITMFYGLYLMVTVDAAAQGGFIQEGVVGSDLNYFNPVIESNSEAERKINALLYHPLYSIDYPDFLNDSENNPTITPVLIQSIPEWLDLGEEDINNRFKTLRFTLRDDIFWSDGEPITVQDVVYSFERIKEDRGNNRFRLVFSDVTIQEVPGNPLQFDLISERPNPQLIYASNFSPISAEYYGFQISDRLLTDQRSFNPSVTSGYFRFEDGPITDPDNPRGDKVINPIRDAVSNQIKTIVLQKNNVQNYQDVKLDSYIIRRADTLLRIGGENDNSLEKLVDEGKVDLFTRFLGTNLNLSSGEVSDTLGMNQRIVPTNTYYNLYLNIQINDYFINQTLRNYVICQFINYDLGGAYSSQLEEIPADRRLIPIQLGATATPDCSNPDSLLDPVNYSIEVDERTGIKRVLLRSKPFVLNLVGFQESEPLLTDIQIQFRDSGVPAELIKDDRVTSFVNDKLYNAIFVPVTVASRDPYALLGAGGRDFSQIRLNNRILDYQAEENLFAYSLSNLEDQEARNALNTFFEEQFVAVNLFRANMEVNYTDRVQGIEDSIPDVSTFSSQMYVEMPTWYAETRREWVF
jgi:hypothetical protein